MQRLRIFCLAAVVIGSTLPLAAQNSASTMPPVLTTRLGQLMERDWEQRPPWADMAVAILKGEPIGSGQGWFTGSESRYDWDWLAANFPDAVADQRIGLEELAPLDQAGFERLDRDRDKWITQADFEFTKNPYLEDESPVSDIFSRLDDDSNGRLTMDELERWFKRSAQESEFLSFEDLKIALGYGAAPPKRRGSAGPRRDPRWRMMELLLRGEMGSLTEGPELESEAPELDLPLVALNEQAGGLELTDRFVKLADVRGQKPVVLIFGSFT
ncbi:MAG: EF-hand domain-containing protein [Pirellulales bacterium]|nr:EF-hand domain-containing protein [Pirellulales bacterium]